MANDTDELHPHFDAPLRGTDFLATSHDLAAELKLTAKKLERHRTAPSPASSYEWNDKQIISRVSSVRLPGSRDRFLRRYHRQLRAEYSNGGLVSGFYTYRLLNPPEPVANLVCSLFHAGSLMSLGTRPMW